MTILRRLFGAGSPIIVPSLQLLGDLYRSQKRFDEAEGAVPASPRRPAPAPEAYARARPPVAAAGHESGLSLALAENNLATIFLAQAKYGQAEPLLAPRLAGQEESVGEEHPAFTGTLYNLAGLCAVTGREPRR